MPPPPHRLLLAATAALALLAAVGLAALVMVRTLGSGGPTAAALLYYEVLDARQLTLYEVRLDGRSQPRAIAARPSLGEGEVRFDVEPQGRVTLAMSNREGGGVQIEAIDMASGAAAWAIDGPSMDPFGVWSDDGRRYAAVANDEGAPRIALIDISVGDVRLAPLEAGLWPQGFNAAGALVFREGLPAGGVSRSWRFHVIDWAGGAVRPAASGEWVTGPHSTYAEDVAPGLGAGITVALPPEDQETRPLDTVGLVTLDGRILRRLHLADGVSRSWIGFAPDSRSIVAIGRMPPVGDADPRFLVSVMDLDGTRHDIAGNLRTAGEVTLAPDGGIVGLSGWDVEARRSVLTLVDARNGRVVEVPLPPRTVAAAIRAISPGGPLPEAAVAAAPSVPPASPTPTPAALPGAPHLALAWLEMHDDGTSTGRARVLAPAAEGGVATVAEMPPIEIDHPPANEGYRLIELAPRPGTDEILVHYSDQDEFRAFLWTPGGRRTELVVPPGMPRHSWNPHWRPDGGALAFWTEHLDGDAVSYAVGSFEIGSPELTLTQMPAGYDGLAGWAPNGRDFVVRHGVCTEGCGFRYSQVATLGRDGTVHPVEVGDVALGTQAFSASIEATAAREIVLSSIELEHDDDVRVGWPIDRPALDRASFDWSPDGRDLLAWMPMDDVVHVYRIADPLAHVVDGRVRIRPEELAALPPGTGPRGFANGLDWVIIEDRAGVVWLLELESGRSFEVGEDPEGPLVWLPAP